MLHPQNFLVIIMSLKNSVIDVVLPDEVKMGQKSE